MPDSGQNLPPGALFDNQYQKAETGKRLKAAKDDDFFKLRNGNLLSEYGYLNNISTRIRPDKGFHLTQTTKLVFFRPMQSEYSFLDMHALPLYNKERTISRMVRYCNAQFLDLGINDPLLASSLKEELERNIYIYKYDSFAGNRLLSLKNLKDDSFTLICPGSSALNDICVYPLLSEHEALLLPKYQPLKSFRFQTPINQIEEHFNNYPAILVRSMEGCHYFNVNIDTESSYTDDQSSYTKTFDQQPMHIASNPFLTSEAAVTLPSGSILLWNIETRQNFNWRTGSHGNLTDYHRSSWNTVTYAAHPRILLFADNVSAKLGDLRADFGSGSLILHAEKGEHITSIAGNTKNRFQIGIATTNRTVLMDSRYLKKPLLEWKNISFEDHQLFLNFVDPSPDLTGILVWGRNTASSSLLVYDRTDSSLAPPSSRLVYSLEPFWKHPICDLTNYGFFEGVGYQKEMASKPICSPLVGSCFVTHKNDYSGATYFQMDENGAIYAQGYNFCESKVEVDADAHSLHEIIEKCEESAILDIGTILERLANIKNFESCHETLDISRILKLCEDRISSSTRIGPDDIQDPLELHLPSRVENIYEMLFPLHTGVLYSETSSNLPGLDSLLKLNVSASSINSLTKRVSHSDGTVLKPPENIAQTIQDYAAEHQSPDGWFDESAEQLALKVLEKDLIMANFVCVPPATKILVDQDDGTQVNHATIFESNICDKGELRLNGLPSWLLQQWQSDNSAYTQFYQEGLYSVDYATSQVSESESAYSGSNKRSRSNATSSDDEISFSRSISRISSVSRRLSEKLSQMPEIYSATGGSLMSEASTSQNTTPSLLRSNQHSLSQRTVSQSKRSARQTSKHGRKKGF